MTEYIDTHCHLDGEEFAVDRADVVQRAREAGCRRVFLPAIDLKTCRSVMDTCRQYPDVCYPMLGLHPEEVRADWADQLRAIREYLPPAPGADFGPVPRTTAAAPHAIGADFGPVPRTTAAAPHAIGADFGPVPCPAPRIIAIGEVGLDFYWSREFEQQQLLAFEEQVRWSVETRLPLMIHCRKAQNEMVAILKKYADDLPGGVFHCFTGNALEARQLLEFPRFVLGIGGVLTFKKSNLPLTLAGSEAKQALTTGASEAKQTLTAGAGEAKQAGVPLERIVLETDAPYMAPVPMRGKRNEPAYIRYVIARLAEAYSVSEETICQQTTANVRRVFGV
ncbi:MAG: TatD family hydrolase [Prevotella sp.]|nr:TatD family hydrolase [Prevotella sp.]